MVLRIHALSTELANQIAAGEVIERPASVVKELLENARDAGATHISIDVEYGGLNRICIADNGQGIHSEDLPLAVAAHATSKITSLNDLYAIDTMGFRGEALASIASISRLTIQSKTADLAQASQIARCGEQWEVTPSARQQGTTVDVRDLFYNAPVRKRFLKSERAEFHALEAVVRRFALSDAAASLVLKHNSKTLLDLPAARDDKRLQQRLEKLFGKPFMQAAKYIDTERAGMRLRGWISDESYQRSQSDKQWIYVNNRMVKDKLLNHALKQAYESVIYPGRHPACLLYLTMPPSEVDVNVHPTKHELRFQQPRLIHDFVMTQVSESIGTQQRVLIADASAGYETGNHLRSQGSRWQLSEPQIPMSSSTLHASQSLTSPQMLQSLTPGYGLLSWQNGWLLCDKRRLLEQAWHWHIAQQTLPLDSRPLLVPLFHPIPDESKTIVETYLLWLRELGIDAEIKQDKVQWRTTPMALSQLPLQELVPAILDQRPQNIESLIALCIQLQLGVLSTITEAHQDLIAAFCEANQEKITQQSLPGMTFLTDDLCRSMLDA